MLSYELAKKLKDAGFPQGDLKGFRNYYSKPYQIHIYDIFDEVQGYSLAATTDAPPIKVPTLSELIEACGEGFWRLIRQERGKWFADRVRTGYEASTPEEAVAKLWLRLNGFQEK